MMSSMQSLIDAISGEKEFFFCERYQEMFDLYYCVGAILMYKGHDIRH